MKAKLEVEMPEGCYDCQFCAGIECGVVEGMPTIDLFGEEGLRPKWCPLIPEEITRSRRDWYLKGYNDAKKERDWIPVSEWLPEDTYSSAEMMNEWFLITTPYGEMKLVQRQKCVPEGFIWFDGYNSYGAVAWKKEELYKID